MNQMNTHQFSACFIWGISVQEEIKNNQRNRALDIMFLQGKMKLGVWYADELHHEFRKPKHLLKVKVFDKDEIWSADLIEIDGEKKFKIYSDCD